MYHPWGKYLYKPINMETIPGYPNVVPKESNKWFPKFLGNDVVNVEYHLYTIGRDLDNEKNEHEVVVMKLLASSLTEESLEWIKGLPDNHPTSYESFSNLFKNRWSTKIDNGMLGAQFIQINKKENETVREFNTIFDRLYNQTMTEFRPTTSSIPLLYMNTFEGKFCFIMKDKKPTSLEHAKEYSVDIE